MGSATPQTPAATPATPTTPAATPPWYEGKADAETIGHWQNKGWDASDPAKIAIEASKAARELQRHFGVPADQLIKLPKDLTDPAQMNDVWQRLGAPKDAKDYDLSGIKIAGADLNAGLADKMRAAMLAAGVAKDRAPGIAKATADYLEGTAAAEASERAARLQTDRAALMKEWGANAEFNRLTAMQGARRLGVTEADVASMENVIGYRRTMELFHRVGAGTTEDTFVDAHQSGNPTTTNGARARLAELQADSDWRGRLLKGGAPERREFDNLMQLIHGAAA